VLVQVLCNPSPSQLPLVHTKIEALSLRNFSKDLHATLAKGSHLCCFFKGCVLIRGHVAIGAYEHVT
jgi:hypothetical protein